MAVNRRRAREARLGRRIAFGVGILTVAIAAIIYFRPFQNTSTDGAWELVLRENNAFYVLVDSGRSHDQLVYEAAADKLCAGAANCRVSYWQTREKMPNVMTADPMQLQGQTALVYVNRNAGKRTFQWNCRFEEAPGCFQP